MPSINNMGGGAVSHTPGPWTVSPSSQEREFWVGPDSFKGLLLCTQSLYSDTASAAANARLIAAAPELLKAAKQALNFIENTEGEIGDTMWSGDVLRAAIAKATLPAASDTVVSAHTALADEASSADKGGMK